MVRKIIIAAVCVCLFFCVSRSADATAYTPYDGTLNNTYVTYFKDIVSGIKFNENYVAFRSGQYEYMLVVGKLSFADGLFSLDGTGTAYVIYNDGSYNSTLSYSVTEITDFSLSAEDKILYSDLGRYPDLIDRGTKYEMLNTFLFVVGLLLLFVLRIFSNRR